jgi:hypothetical protein
MARMGYSTPTIRISFPEVSSPEDEVWIVIRNPMLVPAREFNDAVASAGDSDSMSAGLAALARLVIAWRVYDATWVPELDPETGEPLPGQGGPPLLPFPATAESMGRIPMVAQNALNAEAARAFPQMRTAPPADGTSSPSLPSPSPSTTEPGPEASQSPAS